MTGGDRLVIRKVLTRNDTGETGGHQAGMCVPKQEAFLGFFPPLDPEVKNPRIVLPFLEAGGRMWRFHFIHYNNRLHDQGGTRNEYRLTGLTAFMKDRNLREKDILVLTREAGGLYRIDSERGTAPDRVREGVLRLSGKWRIIRF